MLNRVMADALSWLRCRAAVVLAAVMLAFGPVAQEALAQGCTGTTTAVCTAAGNNYTSGIAYGNANQTLTLESGVVVTTPVNTPVILTGGGTQTLNIASGVQITAQGFGVDAVSIYSSASTTVRAAGSTVRAQGTYGWGFGLESSGAIDAIVGDVFAGTSPTASFAGRGVSASSTAGPVTITTGNVTVQGNNLDLIGVMGVYGFSFGTGANGAVDIDTTGGTVAVTGTNTATGIRSGSAGGPITIKTGAVSNSGSSNTATGIYAAGGIAAVSNAGADSDISIDSTDGAVTLTGATTDPAIAVQAGHDVDIKTASVSTVGTNAHGIHVQYSSGNTGGKIDIDTTAGTTATIGATARGISAAGGSGLPNIGGVITIKTSDVTTGGTGAAHGIIASSSAQVGIAANDISTAGVGAVGVYVIGTGAGGASITAGDITTTGAGAHAIQVNETGTTEIDIAGTLSTIGNDARAVSITKTGNGAATTVNAGVIETDGDNATGVHIYSGTSFALGGGAITVTANSIHTSGDTVKTGGHYVIGVNADGIDVYTGGAGVNGRITIDTSVGVTPGTLGSVVVEGRKARGIVAESGLQVDGGIGLPDIMLGGGAIDIIVGDVTTLGEHGTAVSAENFGTGADGAITIRALGTVSTSGANPFYPPGDVENESNHQPVGIYAYAWGGGAISITAHDVSTVGDSASAISAQSGNGPADFGEPPQIAGSSVTIDTTAGSLSTKGGGSHGVGVGGASGVVTITTADITTEGFAASGIQAGNSGPNSAMTIDTTAGKILTKGWIGAGISAGTGSFTSGQANAGLLTIRAGDIETQGESATAISAGAYNGAIDITVTGALKTGLLGGDGVSIRVDGTTAATVTVDGSIATMASGADGISSSGPGGAGKTDVTVNGSITAAAADAFGVVITGIDDKVTVAAEGEVSGNVGIQMQQLGTAKVTNTGKITGTGGTAVNFLGNFVSTFDNDGTVDGDVNLGAGADTAILRSNSAITGDIDGGSGVDLLWLTGAGSAEINVATLLNFESADKTGTGKWSLTGTSSTFAPELDVQEGILAINGSFTALDAMVQDGATLGGGGTLAKFTALSGSHIAPGNSIGTLTVAQADFQAGSIFEVEISPTLTDLLTVTDFVDVDPGAFVHVIPEAGIYTVGAEYLILEATTPGGRHGDFGGVTDTSAFLQFVLDQTHPDRVYLRVAATANFVSAAITPNQIATAEALDDVDAADPMIQAILPLGLDDARAAFDQLSGEVYSDFARTLIEDSRMPREAALDRVEAAFAAIAAGKRNNEGPDFWVRGIGNAGVIQGDGNAAAIQHASGGLLVGVDGLLSDNFLLGFEAGISSHSAAVPDRSSEAMASGYHLGVYGGAEFDALRVKFGASYSGFGVHVEREPRFAGFVDSLAADYLSSTVQAFGEIGYAIELGEGTLDPFIRVAAVEHSGTDYDETGGPAALNGATDGNFSTIVTFGLAGSTEFVLNDGTVIKGRGRVGWEQHVGATPTATHAFAGGAPFMVAAPGYGSAFAADATLGIDLADQSSLEMTFKGGLSASRARASVGLTLAGYF
jgi:fibronectin-binding autotransporter adhesin